MEILRFDDAAAFLRHAGPFFRANAIDNNVMLGIAGRLIDTPQDDAVMVTVDDDGTPCFAGLVTPPWRLIVFTGPSQAIPILVEAVRDPGAKPPGIVGLGAMAEQFATAWTAATGEKVASGTAMNLHVADRVDAPADVRGALRLAEGTEAEWVTECFIQFAIDIDADESERGESRKSAAAYMARGEVWVWGIGGTPVSMVCYNRTGRAGLHPAGPARPGLRLGGGGGNDRLAARRRRGLVRHLRRCGERHDQHDLPMNRL